MENSYVLSLHGPLPEEPALFPPAPLPPFSHLVTLSPSMIHLGDPLHPRALSLLGSSHLELGLSPFGPLILPALLEEADILPLRKGSAGSQGKVFRKVQVLSAPS